MIPGPAHFIYLGGSFPWQYRRAIETARVHQVPIWFWYVEDPPREDRANWPSDIAEMLLLDVPERHLEHPIQKANIKDLYAWNILYEYGGIYLDLDTISLRPAWNLLTRGICIGREYPEWDEHPHPFNSAVVLAKHGEPLLRKMARTCEKMLRAGVVRWGALGPHLLTLYVSDSPKTFDIAPYRALNGWSYHSIGDYYRNPRDPGEEVRVVHLYSSDHLDEFYADLWMPETT
jgi:Glycosyltransferase sugar-binding region containing DXD motif